MESFIIILVYLICGILASMIHIRVANKISYAWDSIDYAILGFIFLIGPLYLSLYGICYLLSCLGASLFRLKCSLDDWWFCK